MVFGIVKRARNRGLWKEIFVGGCCKTTPDHISKLRKRIDEVDDL
jgi:homocysteine S-methyltransferase